MHNRIYEHASTTIAVGVSCLCIKGSTPSPANRRLPTVFIEKAYRARNIRGGQKYESMQTKPVGQNKKESFYKHHI